MAQQNLTLGIWLMIATMFIFAVQDSISRHLADSYNVMMVVMVRYWFFAAFVIAFAARQTGGLRAAAQSKRPWLQGFRSALLVLEICVTVLSFVYLGLVESHAIFICYPLIIAGLSGPVLGEKVGWRRWLAIGVGFVGVLIVLQPSDGIFSPYAIIPLIGALLFALYGLLTRYVARFDDAMTSFFWTGTIGAVVATLAGLAFWEPMTATDWGWMTALSCAGILGHFLLIKCYEVAEASALQPFAYLQLAFASAFGVAIYAEVIRPNVAVGSAVIIAAGLFTFWREHRQR
ncbi:DMT family transporter [Pelagimonas varians]|uniref:EamA-like transporter family protein n=1 Tax=Pelagimonas varians TaxID=696760 RepID=A0A238K3H9_9RHOB|nr:DMT family transporter [Pelagimonas varians]PYG30507.1 drug/metabolite transporter (DMT)-like permease [Pelagimonas varians]SMX37415.1 EamA-like transporter family protein [Pelagimonas varians]